MATAITDPLSGLQGILDKVIGSNTTTKGTTSLDINSILQNLMQTATNQNVAGQTAQNTASTQQTNANVADLQKVFGQQQSGITPDALKAIFTEGAKAVPGLVATTANAVGARPGDNSALASSLTDLNTNLTDQAALMSQNMLAQSGNTATQIADLTKGITNTGTTTGTQATNTIGNTTQNQNQTQNTGQVKNENTDQTTGINVQQSAAAAGLAGLVSLLGGSGALGSLGSLGSSGLTQLGQLFGIQPSTGGIFGPNGGNVGDASNGTAGVGNPADPNQAGGASGDPYNPNGTSTITNPISTPVTSDPGNLTINDPVDSGVPSFADGGQVPIPQLSLADTPIQNPANLLRALGMNAGNAGITAGGGGINIGALLQSMTNGAGSTPAIPVNMTDNNAGIGAADAGSATGVAANGTADGLGNPVGPSMASPTAGQAIGLGLAGLTGNPIGLIGSIASLIGNNFSMNNNISQIAPNTDTVSTISPEESAVAPVGQVSVDAPADSSTDSSTSADSSSGDSSSGDSGDSGDGSGSGWKDGGEIPDQKQDPTGTKDGINIHVSGGEYIMPKDVVDFLGSSFFDHLRDNYHTPAVVQKAA